jgi:hypothetical protein
MCICLSQHKTMPCRVSIDPYARCVCACVCVCVGMCPSPQALQAGSSSRATQQKSQCGVQEDGPCQAQEELQLAWPKRQQVQDRQASLSRKTSSRIVSPQPQQWQRQGTRQGQGVQAASSSLCVEKQRQGQGQGKAKCGKVS